MRAPAGHPRSGTPPFTFAESARDALRLKRLHHWRDWSLPGLLFKLEAYNGFGYRKRGIPSPYLWSFSHHSRRGKFVRDGVYNPAAVDRQCGTATLLRRLAERQAIAFADEPVRVIRYARSRPSVAADVERAEALQHWLNTFPEIYLKVDGWPGARTSSAFKAVTGRYLLGDPRGET